MDWFFISMLILMAPVLLLFAAFAAIVLYTWVEGLFDGKPILFDPVPPYSRPTPLGMSKAEDEASGGLN